MSTPPRNIFIACIAVAAALGFFVSGSILYKACIGLDPSAFPAGKILDTVGKLFLSTRGFSLAGAILAFGLVLIVAVATFFAMRYAIRAREGAEADPGRRRFLSRSGAALAAAFVAALVGGFGAFLNAISGLGRGGRAWGLVGREIFQAPVAKTHPEWLEAWKGSRIRRYGRLGRTGWRVSDIVLGANQMKRGFGEPIARSAIERGVNYFDTAPDYSAMESELTMGLAIKGLRDRVFIASKFCTPNGHLPVGTSVEAYKAALEGSLRRLGTDHIDLVHVHSCDEVERLMDPNVHEAFDRLKQEGKVRFLGFTSHTPNLVDVANTAIDSGRFDVMMVAYHHGIWPVLKEVIARARREQDMGVVAMKTLKGAKHHGLAGFREHADTYSQAALTWTLSNRDVSCAVVSFFKQQHVDEYLHASGRALRPEDVAVLEKYDREILGTYCAPHCGECLRRCPEQLAIPDILRHRMYCENYGWKEEGLRRYAALERNAAACALCSAPCSGACPIGVPIRERMIGAHALLRRAVS